MGAMAAAVIAATTWLAVRTARVDDDDRARRGGFAGGAQQGQTAAPPRQRSPRSSRPSRSRAAWDAGARWQLPRAPRPVAMRDAGGLIAIDAAGTVTGLTADAATPR